VKLIVYNLLGQEVRQIVNKNMTSGYYRVFWNGRNESGEMVSTGVYLYKIMITNRSTGEIYLNKTQKMMMVK
jgi:flagellar hook assembly protein FlgD